MAVIESNAYSICTRSIGIYIPALELSFLNLIVQYLRTDFAGLKCVCAPYELPRTDTACGRPGSFMVGTEHTVKHCLGWEKVQALPSKFMKGGKVGNKDFKLVLWECVGVAQYVGGRVALRWKVLLKRILK